MWVIEGIPLHHKIGLSSCDVRPEMETECAVLIDLTNFSHSHCSNFCHTSLFNVNTNHRRKMCNIVFEEKPHFPPEELHGIYFKPEALTHGHMESMRSLIHRVRGVTHQYELTLHHDVFGCVAKQTLGSSLYVVLK